LNYKETSLMASDLFELGPLKLAGGDQQFFFSSVHP
jgi:hypothetical protein